MDLFKIFGTISLKGTEEAEQELKDVAGEGENTSSKLGKVFSGIGNGAIAVGKTIASGIAIGSVAVAKLGKDSISSYADYEQLVGGVETLFKDSAGTIMNYADQAYETAGLSANEYMETITSFSASLLQSLGGDTVASAEKGNQAIIDMSDNANKMGTSMESIQNAYQGFAKQNYTMLDNLKLGYGGTKEEMQRLLDDASKLSGIEYDISSFADITDAIHVVQTEMGITGTTAKESASTISGSIGSMKAQWQNLLTAFSGDGWDIGVYVENFVSTVGTAMGNIIPKIEAFLPNLVDGIESLVEMALPIIVKLIQSILPTLISGATALLNSLVNALPSIIKVLMDSLPLLIDGIMKIFKGIVNALPMLIKTICDALPTLIPQLLDAFLEMIIYLCEHFSEIIQPIIDILPELITNIVDILIENLPALIDGVIQLVLGIVGATSQIYETLIPMIPEIFQKIVEALIENLPAILEGIWEIIKAVVGLIGTLVTNIWEAIKGCWKVIVDEILAPIGQWIYDNVIAPIVNFFKGLWDSITETFSSIGTWFKDRFTEAWDNISNAFESVGEFFSGIWNSITEAFSSVGTWFSDKFSDAWKGIKDAFSTVGEFFSGIWDTITETFTDIGETVGDAVSGAFKTAINWVLEKAIGLINGFISALNFCIDIINNIPGVEIGYVDKLEMPEMAKGGVLEKGEIGLLEGNGAEAVVPLENNRKWINNVAKAMNDAINNNNPSSVYGYSPAFGTASGGESNIGINSESPIVDIIRTIIDDTIEKLNIDLYLDGDTLVGGTAQRMNDKLGQLNVIRRRGATV